MRIPLVPWFSFIFCYWCWTHLGIAITVVHGRCPDNQQSLLLQLKSSLQFKLEFSSKLVFWNESIDCCKWNGLKCDDEGHVSGLDLSGESIHGGFDNSSGLFSLRNLQFLNLANNNFNSVIPSGFNKLSNLTYLNLSCAGFVGQIPIEISQLTRLVTLDISSFSYLTGKQLELKNSNLQKIVQNLTMIKQLYLDGVNITAKGHEWTSALLQLPSLQEVSMTYCNLSGPLDSSLTRLKNLSVIRLDGNNLSSRVPETFAILKNLSTLNLVYCGLKGKFPEKIFQITTLSVIDVSFNIELHGSLPEFPPNGHLQTLVVSETSLSGAIPGSISKLRQLSILDLSNCQFNGTLPSSMTKLMELIYLDLSLNKFTGPIPSFNMSKNLTHFDVSYNDLTGFISPILFKGLMKLVYIDLKDNLLGGSLPSFLFALPLLKSTRLSNNNFEGHLHEFSNTSSIMLELDLSGNNLQGPIPASIFNLRSLNILQLSSNKFNGTIHIDMFQRLENLTTLDLSHNNLLIDANVNALGLSSLPKMRNIMLASCNLTEFPSFIRNQSELFNLDLSINHIQGSIPGWIWQFGSLRQLNISHNFLTKFDGPVQNASATLIVIDLRSNQFQGRLPIFPVEVEYLDYSINNFSSSIPPDIGTYLSTAIFLSFSRNSLSGSIPRSLCNKSMVVLDFSHNQFNGTMPECLMQSNSLLVLNLENNKLDGNIADTFPEYCTLTSLFLNGNQLAGPIPKTLLNCTALELLNIGNNQIYDVFPCFLKKISTLRVLVLSKNKLHGDVRCPEINGTWQKLQIVDLAFNNFSGLLPGKEFKTWKAMTLEVHDALDLIQIQTPVLEFDHIYYQDSVTLTSKGLSTEFVKILIVFTSIDFSSNNFHGPIPEELMNFTALHVLNLSHNALAGQIPSSIGNLKQLESLDLSSNNFDGEIPAQLASLNFLSYLNLSYNQLVGIIPTGTQLQSLPEASFEGNAWLCGPPLTTNCSNPPLPPTPSDGNSDSGSLIDWNFLSAELGSILGLGIIILPLMFWERWRLWYWRHVDDLLFRVFPQLDFVYEKRGGKNYRTLRWRPH